ncbi:MAG: hypothetical protein PHD76_13650 [Methylacidiphilales bacterium]|nr:hypothetical protein [Candidatus Methylacidiphilales bacterium]
MIFPQIAAGLLFAISVGFASEPESTGRDHTLIYRAEIPKVAWSGWGYSSPHDPDLKKKPAPAREQLDLVENNSNMPRIFSGKMMDYFVAFLFPHMFDNKPRTFSGKVLGPESMKGVEIGLVSLVGIQWNHDDAYQWTPVAADGSFSITDARYQNAGKALVVRGPNTAWTFLRYNFAPGQSGKNIVLKSAPSKKVRVTASGPDMQDLGKVAYEAWPAFAQIDDEGNALRRQRLGPYNFSDQKFMDLVLPAGEVALRVQCEGWASYYQIIDTREADHFHFVLLHAGKMKISVLNAEGKPKTGVRASWMNPAAPLSFGQTRIKDDGILLLNSMAPGKFDVTVGDANMDGIEVQEGYVTDIVLQDGRKAVISRNKAGSSAASRPIFNDR